MQNARVVSRGRCVWKAIYTKTVGCMRFLGAAMYCMIVEDKRSQRRGRTVKQRCPRESSTPETATVDYNTRFANGPIGPSCSTRALPYKVTPYLITWHLVLALLQVSTTSVISKLQLSIACALPLLSHLRCHHVLMSLPSVLCSHFFDTWETPTENTLVKNLPAIS